MFEELWNYGFPQEMRHFARCVRGKETPIVTGEDGRVVQEVLYAAYQSAGAGSKIELPFRPQGVKRPIDLWLARLPVHEGQPVFRYGTSPASQRITPNPRYDRRPGASRRGAAICSPRPAPASIRVNQRVQIPESVVMRYLETAGKSFTIYGRDRSKKAEFGFGRRNYNSSAGQALWVDGDGRRRYPTLDDVRTAARLADGLPRINIVGAMADPHELPVESRAVVVAAELLKNTTKPITFWFHDRASARFMLELFTIVSGSEAEAAEYPLAYPFLEPISPLRFPASWRGFAIRDVSVQTAGADRSDGSDGRDGRGNAGRHDRTTERGDFGRAMHRATDRTRHARLLRRHPSRFRYADDASHLRRPGTGVDGRRPHGTGPLSMDCRCTSTWA